MRKVERELVEQLGHQPSFAEALIIRRVARSTLQAEQLDGKFDEALKGDAAWNILDARIQAGLANSIRLNLVALGLKKPAPRKRGLSEYLAERGGK